MYSIFTSTMVARNLLVPMLLLNCLTAQTQPDLSHYYFSEKQGLKSNTIYDLYQTDEGIMLVGTEDGLFRFNGVHFKQYNSEGGVTSVGNIFELQGGIIACRNFYGSTYYLQNDILKKDTILPVPEIGFPTYYFDHQKLYRSEKDKIMLISDGSRFAGKVYKIDEHNNAITSADRVYNDTLYSFINRDEKTVLIYDMLNNKKVSSEKLSDTQMSARSGNCFFVKENTVYYFSPENAYVVPFKKGYLSSDKIRLKNFDTNEKICFIKIIDNGYLAIGTYSGLFIYNEKFEFEAKYFDQIPVSAFLQDNEGNYWIGTLLHGLYMVPSLNIKTLRFGENIKISESVKLKDNNLLFGTYDGKLFWTDSSGYIFKTLDLGVSAEVDALHFDSTENKIYFFCKGVYQLDNHSGEILNYFESYSVKDIGKFADTIYCSTSSGLRLFTDKGIGIALIADSLWIKKSVSKENYFIFETSQGLKKYQPSTRKISNINTNGPDSGENFFPKNLTISGNAVFFSQGNAVFELDNKGDKNLKCQFNCTEIKGLAVDENRIIVYDGNQLIIRENDKFYYLDQTKGFYAHSLVGIHTNNSKLVAVSNEGVQFFDKLRRLNTKKPEVKLIGYSGSFEKNSAEFVSDFSDNELKMEFELLPNLSALGKGKIYYRFEGIDENWFPVTDQENFTISKERLPYGKFNLDIYGENEDGFRSERISYSIIVHRPYYATWLFRSSALVLAGLFILILLKWRINAIKKKDFEKLEKERLKTKALNAELLAIRAQMNPHFIFNSISSIQNSILNEDTREAYENLSAFSRLLRQSLQFSSREYIKLSDEIEFLNNYVLLEQMRTNYGFIFEQLTDPDLMPSDFEFPSLLTQPFVENAIRHGLIPSTAAHKKLTLAAFLIPDGYCITIEDNGIGRKRSAETARRKKTGHISFATKAVQERIEMINRSGRFLISLEIIDLDTGTRVVFCIKILKSL